MGRGRPWSLRKSPQALHKTEPASSRRQSGVVDVWQFWQTGGVPPAIPGVGAAPKFMMALLEKDLCCDGDADAALANADSPGKDRLYLFCG